MIESNNFTMDHNYDYEYEYEEYDDFSAHQVKASGGGRSYGKSSKAANGKGVYTQRHIRVKNSIQEQSKVKTKKK